MTTPNPDKSTVVTEGPASTVKPNVADISLSFQRFSYADYFVFVVMLIICALIGIYFGFIEKRRKHKKSNNAEQRRGSEALEYLVGGRQMKVIPISLSLIASFVSGISLLGTSTEIYMHGTQYAFILSAFIVAGIVSWYTFLPVFCNLQLTSTYEYLELRFNKSIRIWGSLLFTLATIIWLPIVIYVPAIAFNQVTGVNIHIVTPIVCIVCIFYTTVGGLKAVVWTDTIQTVVMVGAIILVVVKGTIDVGGLSVVWQRNWDSGRIEAPTMTLDPTERISILTMVFGSTFHYAQLLACNHLMIQRYLSLPSMKEVKSALILFTLGVMILTAICMYNGLLIFATYYDCDPLSTKLAKMKDQLVPLLVMDLLSVFPGVPGLFVAGVFSAALSSLSTGLNSLAAVFLEDYIKPLRKEPLSEHQIAIAMRLSVVLIGIFCVACVVIVERVGTHVMQLSMTTVAITIGPSLGIFLIGLLMPKINAKSAMTGSVIAFITMGWICISAQLAANAGEIVYKTKPVTTVGCTYSFDMPHVIPTNATIVPKELTFVQSIYHMSFMLYAFTGTMITIIVAYGSSFIFGFNDASKINVELLAPFIRRWIRTGHSSDYSSVRDNDESAGMMNLENFNERKFYEVK